MNRPIIIVAPQGAGKTVNAQKLQAALGCTRIVDGWDGHSRLQPGDLALTNEQPPVSQRYQIMTLEEGLARVAA